MPVFADQTRDELRRMYAQAWRKFSAKLPLQPLEGQLAAVIVEHPEYVQWIESTEEHLAEEFSPESGRQNPFLHMGLHLAIREQVATDRPRGIAEIHQKLVSRLGDLHAAEHKMIEPLAQAIWESQRNGQMPDEQSYLERLRALR